MRKLFLILIAAAGFAAVAACTAETNPVVETAPTSTPPAARATQPAIAPDLQGTTQPNSGDPAAGEPRQGGIFTALWSDPPTLDPALVTDGTSYGVVIEVFSGLVTLGADPNDPIQPDLAESWTVSNGGTVYEFRLRSGIKFSNGDPVTATDFKWSWERAVNPNTRSTIAEEFLGDIVGISDIVDGRATEAAGIEVIDDRTLKVTIDAPKPYFIAKLTYPTAFVLNQANVSSGGRNWTDTPVSTGPFILKEYRIGQRIRLARNDNYWGSPPYLNEVVFNLAGGVAMAMYENDEIDVTGVGLADLERVQDPTEEISKELVQVPPDFAISYVGFNIDQPPFDDVHFRRALNLAVDKQLIADQVFSNLVKPADGIVPPGFIGYSESVQGLSFDLTAAQEELALSAYADPATRPRIILTIPGTGGSPGLTTEVVADMWRQNLGIEIEIQQVEWATYLQDLHRGRLQAWSGLSWQADYPDPNTFVDVLFRSDSAINYGRYSNAEVDALVLDARTEQDVASRLGMYQRAEQIILDDAAWVPLWWGVEGKVLVKPWVEGLIFPSLTIPKYKDVWISK